LNAQCAAKHGWFPARNYLFLLPPADRGGRAGPAKIILATGCPLKSWTIPFTASLGGGETDEHPSYPQNLQAVWLQSGSSVPIGGLLCGEPWP